MFKRILFPTDGSDVTAKALTMAVSLAKTYQAEVVGLCVKEPFPYAAMAEVPAISPQVFLDQQEAQAQRHLANVKQACDAAGVSCSTLTAEGVHPYEEIIDTADKRGCDLIVMASHGRRGMQALLLGSETQKVLTHSKVPVMVVR